MSKILIKNAKAIVTCNAKDDVFYDSDLLIDGAKISAIGKNLPAEDAEVILVLLGSSFSTAKSAALIAPPSSA